MRFLPLAVLLLCACAPDVRPPDLASGSYGGAGRNRLCIAGEGAERRAGFIIYGKSDTNCSASGRLEGQTLIPRGEGECRIPLQPVAGGVRIAALPGNCAYYCAPGAAGGETFTRQAATLPVTDLAGDPLC